MKKILLLLILINFNCHAASMKKIGEKGDPNKVDRVIIIEMHDNYFYPKEVSIKKGETIKFIVKNLGYLVHEYNIGTKEMHIKHQPEMARLIEHEIIVGDKIDHKKMIEMSKKDHSLAHKHANSVMLEPNKIGEIIWKFNTDAKLEAACNVPGHYEDGMVSNININ
tara:strand:+ start:432 stop:929 length:498 start_codon:yes stop_codon:yes gene_type:complete